MSIRIEQSFRLNQRIGVSLDLRRFPAQVDSEPLKLAPVRTCSWHYLLHVLRKHIPAFNKPCLFFGREYVDPRQLIANQVKIVAGLDITLVYAFRIVRIKVDRSKKMRLWRKFRV